MHVRNVIHNRGDDMILTIDRIEESIVVCEKENREMINLKITEFNYRPVESDIVFLDSNGKFSYDEKATNDKKKSISERFNKLFKK